MASKHRKHGFNGSNLSISIQVFFHPIELRRIHIQKVLVLGYLTLGINLIPMGLLLRGLLLQV
jgi:hypothetical protein